MGWDFPPRAQSYSFSDLQIWEGKELKEKKAQVSDCTLAEE